MVLDDVFTLTGGRIYSNITAQDIQGVKDLKAKEDALNAVIDKANSVIEAAQEEYRLENSTVESITAAGEAAWSE